MTYEEAIEILKVAKAEVEWNYPLEYQFAIDMAIEALEKQIRQIGAVGKIEEVVYDHTNNVGYSAIMEKITEYYGTDWSDNE